MYSYLPERFALTGATGALGFSFLQYALARNPKLQVTLLVRENSEAYRADGFQRWLRQHRACVTLVEGDLRALSAEAAEAMAATPGGLWHFAAVTSLTALNEETARQIHAVNVDGTERLAQACLRSKMPFFHISTAYVVGERSGLILETERAMKQVFRNPYEASKLAAETIVQRLFAAGVPGAIFRPSVVVDNQGGVGALKVVDACAYSVALATKRGEPFIFRQPVTSDLNMIRSEWVIAALLDLARLPSGPGRTYHLTAPESTRFRAIADLLEELVPEMKISFEPDLDRRKLPSASKIFDKAVTEIRPYFNADIRFDRRQVEEDLSADFAEQPMNLIQWVRDRLASELHKLRLR